MGYIQFTPVTVQQLTCTHPKVDKIWEYGGLSANPTSTINHHVAFILKDGTRQEFKGETRMEDAEKFLSELPE